MTDTAYIEVCTDQKGVLLWAEPYRFKRLNGPGEIIIRDRVHLQVVVSGIQGEIIKTVVRRCHD